MRSTISYITINKVNQMLSKLQDEYPEVYNVMDEEPFGHLIGTKAKIDNKALLNYVKDIEALLKQLDVTRIRRLKLCVESSEL